MESKEEIRSRVQQLIDETDVAIKEARSYLVSQGEVVDLSSWVTIKKYCELFGIKNTETVTNWISRGIIPAENIRVVAEFNNTRLIKAVPYHVRAEKSA